jgi:hypothetical protein
MIKQNCKNKSTQNKFENLLLFFFNQKVRKKKNNTKKIMLKITENIKFCVSKKESGNRCTSSVVGYTELVFSSTQVNLFCVVQKFQQNHE